jgi:hypothetical protein
MRGLYGLLTLVVACWLLSGNTVRAADADSLIADQVKMLTALADALEKKDEAGIRNATGMLVQNRAKLAELKLSDDDKRKLTDKYGADLGKANQRIDRALGQLDLGLGMLLSGAGNAEAMLKQMIQLMNDLTDAIDKKDEAKGKELARKWDDLNKKMNALRLPEADQRKLQEKYGNDIFTAAMKLGTAVTKEPDFVKKIDLNLGGSKPPEKPREPNKP